ncbi:MAG: hypothetical protein KAW00_06990 [Dehalococcoidia bacterium]|nr:hypothetical protein [Dehalococcoidia bacterium]
MEKRKVKRKKRIMTHPENCSGCSACQLACSFLLTGVFNPLKAYIKINWSGDLDRCISFTDECTTCGACVKYCNYGALELDEYKL